jgi:hypothetical protein
MRGDEGSWVGLMIWLTDGLCKTEFRREVGELFERQRCQGRERHRLPRRDL